MEPKKEEELSCHHGHGNDKEITKETYNDNNVLIGGEGD